MTIEQKIQAEQNRLNNELNQMKEQNEQDKETLGELRQDHLTAVLNGGTEEIMDAVYDQIMQTNARIERRNVLIETLEQQANPTIIQNMIVDELQNVLDQVTELDNQVQVKLKELQPLHQSLVDGLQELMGINERSAGLRRAINYYSVKYLTEDSKNTLGLNGEIDEKGTILAEINRLLVGSHQVFKR